ncbi:type III pantothenate kinase [Caldalkalibacillus mannanilyticus]|uniref:type III pantothenate kinase n=1 Tax=Caldalkalibacillus mannanilyticus TaxID=1418 RepID=UPI00046811FD|nr:type III pantothenate kinase [Caldalkalibacillus mannanilyticus]
MILVIDVGNTNIVLGVYQEDKLTYHWRVNTDKQKTEDEYGMLVKGLFREEGLLPQDVKGIIISSVVPPLMFSLERMCRKYFKNDPIVVGPGIKTGLSIHYDNPKDVGADRIVNAVAALQEYKPPLIIVDFGTATTFCYIDEEARYIGGAIAPGIQISTQALYHHAAKLPRIELKFPQHVVGRNTIAAMQSGILFGYAGQVDSIIKRMKQQAKEEATIIATGGLAELIANESEYIDHVDPFLTLKGLYNIYHRNV